MLIAGDTVIVIGYSYQRGGTEIGLFAIDVAGNLRYQSTYHLRSNDYYSSRNYASRLIGNKLIFYTPLRLSLDQDDPFAAFPALRRWHTGATATEFQPIVPATRVYRPAHHVNALSGLTLHTVTVCDLALGDLACEGTAVVGPPGRVFYVSPGSVYVWVSEWSRGRGQAQPAPMLYRMPLNATAPSALGVSGSPVDQFSFLESEDGHLNVLVRSQAAGDGMWSAERQRAIWPCFACLSSALETAAARPRHPATRGCRSRKAPPSRTGLSVITCCTVRAVAGDGHKQSSNRACTRCAGRAASR